MLVVRALTLAVVFSSAFSSEEAQPTSNSTSCLLSNPIERFSCYGSSEVKLMPVPAYPLCNAPTERTDAGKPASILLYNVQEGMKSKRVTACQKVLIIKKCDTNFIGVQNKERLVKKLKVSATDCSHDSLLSEDWKNLDDEKDYDCQWMREKTTESTVRYARVVKVSYNNGISFGEQASALLGGISCDAGSRHCGDNTETVFLWTTDDQDTEEQHCKVVGKEAYGIVLKNDIEEGNYEMLAVTENKMWRMEHSSPTIKCTDGGKDVFMFETMEGEFVTFLSNSKVSCPEEILDPTKSCENLALVRAEASLPDSFSPFLPRVNFMLKSISEQTETKLKELSHRICKLYQNDWETAQSLKDVDPTLSVKMHLGRQDVEGFQWGGMMEVKFCEKVMLRSFERSSLECTDSLVATDDVGGKWNYSSTSMEITKESVPKLKCPEGRGKTLSVPLSATDYLEIGDSGCLIKNYHSRPTLSLDIHKPYISKDSKAFRDQTKSLHIRLSELSASVASALPETRWRIANEEKGIDNWYYERCGIFSVLCKGISVLFLIVLVALLTIMMFSIIRCIVRSRPQEKGFRVVGRENDPIFRRV